MNSYQERIGEVVVGFDGNVVTATVDRSRAKNAINNEVLDGLEAAIDIAEVHGARVFVVRGSGGTFCSGADLSLMDSLRADVSGLEKFVTRLEAVLEQIEEASFASVAVVEGHAVAGGCEMLLACDVALTSTTARIGDRHLEYGLVPGAGGSVRLGSRLTPARANYLLLSGDLLTGEQAADWGLATFAAEPEQLDAVAARVVGRLATRSLTAMDAVKQLIANNQRLSVDDALLTERSVFLEHMNSSDVAEGLDAFRHGRTPIFG